MRNPVTLILAAVAIAVSLTARPAKAQQPTVACETAYTVQPGDWLGKVAAQTYGDAALYPAIVAATNANLGPDYVNFIEANHVILPGWKLCLPSQADAAELAAATDDPTTLTVDDLQNATYTSEYAGEAPITLVNGEYRQPVPDSTGEEAYSLADTFAFADFDGDGSEDALAVLISDTAGTGRFFNLMLMLNKDGVPTQADSIFLGDRSPVKAINRVGQDIYVDYVTQGPTDAACCGTQATSQKFRVENGKLVSDAAGIQTSQTSEAMTREKLWNMAYPFDEGEQITFVNGKYAGQPEGEGSASFSAAEMLAPLAFGDLTGDGVEDAAVTFSYSGGGSGDFLYLAVAEGKGAKPVAQASVWLDPAGQINGVAVDNGQVKVDMLRFGPGDAECCATERAIVTYTLQDGVLVEGEAQVITPSSATSAAAALSVAELQNATYRGIYDEPITLTNGKYEGEPFVEGDSSRPTVEYWGETFGDLDGDGVEDAAVFLVENSGDTGNFVYVAAQLNQNGQPVDAGAVSIEDRIQVKSATIEDSQIKLEIITEGPGDAACCKSHKANKSYALQNGQLAELPAPEETLEKISATDLNGTTWTLLELDSDEPVLADAPVTISFADGKISGSGGCNNYNSSFTLAEDNPFGMTISPVAATKKACPDPILNQETAYFTALEKVSQWGYQIGRLVMYYDKGQGEFGTLLYAPPAQEPEMSQAVAAPAPGERITSVVELTAAPVQWLSFTDPTQQFDIADPENYTIAFNPAGTVNVKADCNNARGTYTADDSGSLTIEIGPITKAMCPPDSRSDEFVQKLGFVRNFFMENGFVYLDMLADGGTLKLAPASESMSAPESAPAFGEAWESVSCDTLGVAPAVAAQADCGTVTVPENRAAGTDATIQLAVVRVRSTSANPGSPVVLGTGGPGGDGLQAASDAGFLTSHAGILADRDWVFFSQRGTAKAQPELVCPAYNDVPLQGALNGWTDEEKQAQSIETMQACLDDLTAQGVDLTGYNSVENAADVADLARALGYDKINYYGQSYGTLLGQYLLRDHPEIIETMTLDGIAPASAQRWTDVTDFAAAFERVFAACAADEACATSYPDPEGALAEALAAMDANPPMVTVPMPGGEAKTMAVDEVLAMNALFINLYLPGGYGKVPFLAYELRDGNYDQLATTLAVHFLNSGEARVMHFSIVCSDDPVTSLDEVDVTGVPEMYKELIYDDATSYATFCPRLKLPQLPASSDELPVSDVPALLLQGGLDPATPVDGGNKLVAGLSNNYNVIFPSGSHVQASQSPCALSIFEAFLTDPTTAPDTRCVDPTLSFAVPGPVSVSSVDGQAVITMTRPAGFVAGPQPGQWNDGAMLFALDAFEAGTSVEDALAKPLGVLQLENGETSDGPVIAGYPSLKSQIVTDIQGAPQHLDLFAFADGDRAYRVALLMTNPATLDKVRQTLVPQLLESITLNAEGAASAGDESSRPVPAEGLGDAYFPLEGYPGIDAQHYTLELTVDPADLHYITGTTTIEALATADLARFNLDFLGLNVTSLTVDGAPATFSREGQELIITPVQTITANSPFTVSVTYAGTPELYADPSLAFYGPPILSNKLESGWYEWSDGYIAAFGQPNGGMAWFPSNNHPGDKATYTYRVTVAEPKMAIATGILQEVIPVDDNTNTYVWQMNKPMATQIASVIIGEFELQEGQSPNGVPLRNYFPPNVDPEVRGYFAKTGEMLDFLSNVFGEYPYEAYGVVAVPGWVENSGLETQSITTVGTGKMSEETVVHELGHQWFGDSLTLSEWGDIWLHEGFARYIEALWLEKTQGVTAYNDLIKNQYEEQLEYAANLPAMFGQPNLPAGQVFPPVDQPIEWLYFSSYRGGALALHTLRMEVGDETFFKILPAFYQRHANGSATTEDFIATAEEISGRDLSSWAETWLYGSTIPADFPLLGE